MTLKIEKHTVFNGTPGIATMIVRVIEASKVPESVRLQPDGLLSIGETMRRNNIDHVLFRNIYTGEDEKFSCEQLMDLADGVDLNSAQLQIEVNFTPLSAEHRRKAIFDEAEALGISIEKIKQFEEKARQRNK